MLFGEKSFLSINNLFSVGFLVIFTTILDNVLRTLFEKLRPKFLPSENITMEYFCISLLFVILWKLIYSF